MYAWLKCRPAESAARATDPLLPRVSATGMQTGYNDIAVRGVTRSKMRAQIPSA